MRLLHLIPPDIVFQMSSPSGGLPKVDQGLAHRWSIVRWPTGYEGVTMLFLAGMIVIILGDIWLQRFGIPLGGTQFVPIVLFTTYLGSGLTLASDR